MSYLSLQLWDVWHYSWLRGYDAWASSQYVDFVRIHHGLPSAADTDVWHNPPLFYVIAAVVEPHTGWIGLEPHKAVQLISVFAGCGVVIFSFLIARELFPRAPWIQLGTLVAAALTPVLLRGSLMYHPEPLATVLATAGLYLAVRGARRSWPISLAACAGLLFALANLTRAWALAEAIAVVAVCCIVAVSRREAAIGRFVVVFAVVFALLSAPWYVHQEIRYGNPLAFSKPDPSQWLPSGRPSSFFTSLKAGDVFTNPYAPTFRNELLPVMYTDWWGDFWRYFHVPAAEAYTPPRLQATYRQPLVLQSVVGLAPTLLGILGAASLAAAAIRRRRADLGIPVAAAAFVLIAFIAFLIRYPKLDGDNIKALYVIDLVPTAALCIAWSVDRLRSRSNRLVFGAALLWFIAITAYDVHFLVLTPT